MQQTPSSTHPGRLEYSNQYSHRPSGLRLGCKKQTPVATSIGCDQRDGGLDNYSTITDEKPTPKDSQPIPQPTAIAYIHHLAKCVGNFPNALRIAIEPSRAIAKATHIWPFFKRSSTTRPLGGSLISDIPEDRRSEAPWSSPRSMVLSR